MSKIDHLDCIDTVKLDRLAELSVKVGLNLTKGQDLVITAPIAAAPLVRLVASHAYRAGAGVVTPLFTDDMLSLVRFRQASDASFDRTADWLYAGMAKAFSAGAARLAIVGDNPLLLADQDPQKIARLNRALSVAYQPALEKIVNFDINWNIISYPEPFWASLVFPDLDEKAALQALANALFTASRLDGEDPIGDWALHDLQLKKRSRWLNEERFAQLHFQGPGTDLRIGLAEGHEWHGGSSVAKNGVRCLPNIPTEEVFTTPHAYLTQGYVSGTKPLSHQGSVIDGIRVKFEQGRIVEAYASKGEAVLKKTLAMDEGASRLGEVALVPHSSPISASGLLFYNTLFDENAACHIALGQCYSQCFLDSASLKDEDIQARGGNKSIVHIDWMIGSSQMNIDGIKQDGSLVPVFRQGEWAN